MSNKVAPYKIYRKELGPMENFVYLIHDLTTHKGAIVDPAWDVKTVLDFAAKKNITLTDILLTHSHDDHINGLQQTLTQYDAQIHLLNAEAKFWGKQQSMAQHYGGDEIQLGASKINILHTPGHTPGSACYHIGDDLIAGDTLFVFGCGRCDLAGGDPEQMFHTLKKMKTELPQCTCIHPGHNYAPQAPTSRWQTQCEGNPFLHFEHVDDFKKYRLQIHDKIRDTPYHAISKQTLLNQLKNVTP